MDIQSVLIAVSCFVVSAVVIYLVTKCSMRERSWEEVKEEQRRQQEAIWKRPATDKKEKKKKGKGKGLKKEKVETTSKQQEEEPHKMVEIEPDPEIIEPPEEIKPIESPKRTTKLKGKLKNKDEHSLVRQDKEVPELFHRMAMDDVDVKHERERRRSQSESADGTEVEQTIVQEEVLKVEAHVQQAAPPASVAAVPQVAPSRPKKPRRKPAPGDGSGGMYYNDLKAVMSMLLQMCCVFH